ALVWSALTALRAARRRSRQGRVESYFQDAQRIVARFASAATPDARRAARDALAALRERAVEELAAERLEANPSLVILMEYAGAPLDAADRALAVQPGE